MGCDPDQRCHFCSCVDWLHYHGDHARRDCPERDPQHAGVRRSLKKLADDFRYSDPLSSDKTKALEADMQSQIGDLQQAITDGDVESAKQLCEKLAGSLRERNRVCAVNK